MALSVFLLSYFSEPVSPFVAFFKLFISVPERKCDLAELYPIYLLSIFCLCIMILRLVSEMFWGNSNGQLLVSVCQHYSGQINCLFIAQIPICLF